MRFLMPRISRGMAIINLLQLQADEKITAMIAYKESGDNRYLIMATKCGLIKKTKLSEYFNIRKSGLIAIGLKENDELIEVKATNGQRDILIITKTEHAYGLMKRMYVLLEEVQWASGE